jgi:hypothetical protein
MDKLRVDFLYSSERFLNMLSFKNEFQAGRELDTSDRIFTVYPLALF